MVDPDEKDDFEMFLVDLSQSKSEILRNFGDLLDWVKSRRPASDDIDSLYRRRRPREWLRDARVYDLQKQGLPLTNAEIADMMQEEFPDLRTMGADGVGKAFDLAVRMIDEEEYRKIR